MSFEEFEIFAVGIVVGSVIGLLVSALLNARAISEMQEAKDNYEMLAEEMEDAAEEEQ